jgi:hypothetical protein
MKYVSTAIFFLSFPAFASYPFNGTFCGKGTFTINGEGHVGTKTLEITTSEHSLELKRSRIVLEDGSYIEGRPEQAQIQDGKIIYQDQVVGTISDYEIHTVAKLNGYDIEYFVENLGPGRISYLRSSKYGSFPSEESFPELAVGTSCP